MRLTSFASLLITQLLLSVQIQVILCGKAILKVVHDGESPQDEHTSFCVRSYPKLYNVSQQWSDAAKFDLSLLLNVSSLVEDVNTCQDEQELDVLSGKVALISDERNCSVDQRTWIAQSHGAVAVLLTSSASVTNKLSNATAYSSTIPVNTFLLAKSHQELFELAKNYPKGQFAIIAPPEPSRDLDASIVIIFLMAIFTVGAGSLWSGYTKHSLRLKKAGINADGAVSTSPRHRRSRRRSSAHGADQTLAEDALGDDDDEGKVQQQEEELSVKVTPILVVFFVACMCGMLVLLYFFFDKLVYVIMGMFILASIIATYSCFEPLVMWTYRAFPSCPTIQLPRCNMYLFALNMELRQFTLLLFSVALSIVWLVFRKEDWAWILQDILGILFSINMLKVLRLPSYKICTILLSILFIYDIFFVFITPHLTPDGKSVMVEVATGGGTGEQLPMVLKVPHMGYNPYSVCWIPYSMLGFGDILVPGLLLSYCHSFDLYRGTPCKAYWTMSYISYCLSLLVCFVGLFVMDNAQPALLYIVPGTLIPVALLALVRGELKDFWDGDGSISLDGENLEEDEEDEEEADEDGSGEDRTEETATTSATGGGDAADVDNAVSSSKDKKNLLE